MGRPFFIGFQNLYQVLVFGLLLKRYHKIIDCTLLPCIAKYALLRIAVLYTDLEKSRNYEYGV